MSSSELAEKNLYSFLQVYTSYGISIAHVAYVCLTMQSRSQRNPFSLVALPATRQIKLKWRFGIIIRIENI